MLNSLLNTLLTTTPALARSVSPVVSVSACAVALTAVIAAFAVTMGLPSAAALAQSVALGAATAGGSVALVRRTVRSI